MKRYKTILFDFDDTLIKEHEFAYKIAKNFNDTNKLGYEDPKQLFYELNNDIIDLSPELKKAFWQEYMNSEPDEMELFPNVIETLNKLKEQNFQIAIVSTSNKDRIIRILHRHKIDTIFDLIIGGDDVKNKKPDPEPILVALQKLNAKPQETLYVGDHPDDILASNAAGVDIAFFETVKRDKQNLTTSKPTYEIESFEDILSL